MEITNKIGMFIGEPATQNEASLADVTNKAVSISKSGMAKSLNAAISLIKKTSSKDIQKLLSGSFRNMLDMVVLSGYEDEVLDSINMTLGTRFSSLDDISRLRLLGKDAMRHGNNMSEGVVDKLMSISKVAKMYKAMNNIAQRSGYKGDAKKMIAFSILWVLMAGGKLSIDVVMRGKF